MGLANLRGRGTLSLNEGIDGFRAAMAAMGLFPPEIIPDGEYHRFTYGEGKKNTKGFYRLFTNPVVAGSFGAWGSEGFRQKWSQVNTRELTLEERREFAMAIKKVKEENEEKTRVKREEAAKKAQATYQASFTNELDRHPYVERKDIVPVGARVTRDGRLIIPVRDSRGKTISAQYINAEGVKRFELGSTTKGGYASVNKGGIKPAADIPLVICEGWATACSIFEATKYPVVAGLSSKGVIDAAHILRGKFGFDIPIIVCAEDDWTNKVNVGYDDARQAAVEIGAAFAVPVFGEDRTKDDTDFNDMMRAHGPEAVANVIKAAQPLTGVDHEHEPQRSQEVLPGADSDRAPGIEVEPGFQGGTGDEAADSGDHGTFGDAEAHPGQSDELIPLAAYEEYTATDNWLDPYPGAMEKLFEICMAQQNKPQPALTVGAALAAMSACLHGKYRWPDRLRGNLYIIGLAGTAQGKSEPMDLVEHVVSVAGGFPQSNIGSAQGVEECLAEAEDSRVALVIDEVAHTLSAMTAKNAAAHLSQFSKILLELYSRSKTQYSTRLLADKTKIAKRIFNPYMTLYGTTTHAKMMDISPSLIEDGTLGRCLILDGADFVRSQKVHAVESPRDQIERALGVNIRRIYEYKNKIQAPDQDSTMFRVSGDAERYLDECIDWFDKKSEKADSTRRALYGRAIEQMKRIALVLAVWDNDMGVSTGIERCHLEWAKEFVMRSHKAVLKFVEKMTDDPIVKKANLAHQIIKDALAGNEPFTIDRDKKWNVYAEEFGIVQRGALMNKINAGPRERDLIDRQIRETGIAEPVTLDRQGTHGPLSIHGYRLINGRKN